MMKKYREPISRSFNLATPFDRFLHEIGIVVQENPLIIALSGISTVRLKCGEMKGWHPSITSLR